MKITTFICLLLLPFLMFPSLSQNLNPAISYQVNLQNIDNDQLLVKMDVHELGLHKMTFSMPSIVPGIYGKMDFGTLVSNVKAIDQNKKQAIIKQLDINHWLIQSNEIITNIEYRVDDGWEEFDLNLVRGFYRSASSSFAKERHVITCNSLFGFIEGHTKDNILIEITRHENFYAATAIDRQANDKKSFIDSFKATDYHKLVDSPILYGIADTTHIHLTDIDVEVACYSTTGEKFSASIAAHIRPLLEAQREYLGGKLPVEEYTFIIYHNPSPDEYAYLGDGLEHSHSTLILLCVPIDKEIIKSNVYGIASHEFFHTVMPLGIHSHEIANYNFDEPQMSKHLWLYEGMTEYFTIHMPIKQGLESLEDFTIKISDKVNGMKNFDNTISMTNLSINAMDMQDQYFNVYLKGALINLCLDIELRDLSDGTYGVQDLVQALLERYGPEKSFNDDDLFDIIIELTGQPSIRGFIQKYIEGTTPLPINTYLESVGLTFSNEAMAVEMIQNPSEEALKLRNAWLGSK